MLLLRISQFIFFVADLILKLLKKNVNFHCKDRDGRSPFWYAVNSQSGKFIGGDALYCLLTKKPTRCPLTELLVLRCTEELLDCCPDARFITRPYILLSLVFDAVQYGNLSITTPVILNAVKQNIESCSKMGNVDCFIRNAILCRFLEGDLNSFESFKVLFSILNKVKLTPCPEHPLQPNLDLMETAAIKGDLNVVKYLQHEFKVPLRDVSENYHYNPLDWAILQDQYEVVSYLLSQGVRPSKTRLAEMPEMVHIKASIKDEVTAYTRTPVSLFALSKLTLIETYNNSELDEIFPKTMMNQIRE